MLLSLGLFAEVQLLQRFSQRGRRLQRQLDLGFVWAARTQKHTLTPVVLKCPAVHQASSKIHILLAEAVLARPHNFEVSLTSGRLALKLG